MSKIKKRIRWSEEMHQALRLNSNLSLANLTRLMQSNFDKDLREAAIFYRMRKLRIKPNFVIYSKNQIKFIKTNMHLKPGVLRARFNRKFKTENQLSSIIHQRNKLNKLNKEQPRKLKDIIANSLWRKVVTQKWNGDFQLNLKLN